MEIQVNDSELYVYTETAIKLMMVDSRSQAGGTDVQEGVKINHVAKD